MAEAIPSVQPEPTPNQTTKKLPNGEKSAFRRNPLLATSAIFKQELAEPSLDTSAADGIPSLQVDTQSTQEGNLTPTTPPSSGGSKWSVGNLFQLPGSIKRHWGFSPLASVSVSPQSSPQVSAMSMAQVSTDSTAPAKPKKNGPPASSARDARARNRRHVDSAIKPVNPTTDAKNQRRRASRVKEPSPTSSESEAQSEEENAPVINPHAETGAPTAKPTIRWPSRSLDRMNQNKRKRMSQPKLRRTLSNSHYQRPQSRSQIPLADSKCRRLAIATGATVEVRRKRATPRAWKT